MADVKVGPWGGDGGNLEWEFKCLGGSNLSKIQLVSSGECIVSLKFSSHNQTSGTKHSNKFGGGSGYKSVNIVTHDIQLGYGEQVKEIRGTVDDYDNVRVITSLTFLIGTKVVGPYGKVIGTAFSLNVVDGRINGFWGNSEKYINSMGVYLNNS